MIELLKNDMISLAATIIQRSKDDKVTPRPVILILCDGQKPGGDWQTGEHVSDNKNGWVVVICDRVRLPKMLVQEKHAIQSLNTRGQSHST
jgi:hypothetical protein